MMKSGRLALPRNFAQIVRSLNGEVCHYLLFPLTVSVSTLPHKYNTVLVGALQCKQIDCCKYNSYA